MRDRTKQIHEHSVSGLKLGLIVTSKPLYAETLSLFAPIFEYLEAALERNKDKEPHLKQLFPLVNDLRRGPRFRKDIAYYSQGSHHVIPSSPELDNYLNHFKELEDKSPIALVAYIYHMNMAIFAGGFLLKKMVTRAMKLKSDEGVQAYLFDTDRRAISKRLKQVVNAMDLSPEQDELIMKESEQVFTRNDALMASLRNGKAFRDAEADCCRFVTKVTIAVVVGIVAIGAALMQHSYKKRD